MTAEVAVMNKLGVALAADSAVTFGDEKQRKIYNAANKLFALSKREPVGVMVYGSAEMMGVPWETILKIYRDELADHAFGTLEEYFKNFIAFLEASDRLFDREIQSRYVERNAGSMFLQIRKKILQLVQHEFEEKETVSENEIEALAELVISQRLAELDDLPFSVGLEQDHLDHLIVEYESVIRDAVTLVFQKLPLSDDQIRALVRIGASLACRNLFPASRSGIVIAGFGRDEHFPSLRAAEFDVRAGNRLHYRVVQSATITSEMGATIVPFAQSDVVNLFVEGIDSNYEDMIYGFLGETFQEYPEELLKTLPALKDDERNSLISSWRGIGQKLLERFQARTQKYVQERYIQPILSVVEALPKSELAALAEAFVNLTSLKRRVSMDLETVGGPVDVAVISKGDGFVWIQRKHYFKSELNHQFFRNYFRIETRSEGEIDHE